MPECFLHMQHSFWNNMDFPWCIRHYVGKYNEITPLEKDLVLKEQQTRHVEPCQQEYNMCEENYLFLQEHGFLKRILYCVLVGPCKQHCHLTWFSRDIALMHWILHFLTWILHIKRWFLIEKHATYGTGILFSWRDTISFPRKLRFFQNKMLHLWKDFFIMCRGIVCWKNIAFFQKKCNLYNETCFFTSWGYFIVAFNIAFYNKNAQC